MGRHKEFTVEDALRQALEVFWEKGYEGASLSDLTERMGIQRASLYDTFGSKAELYRQSLQAYQEAGKAGLEAIIAGEPDPLLCLRAILETAVPVCDTERRGCYCVNASVELAQQDPVVGDIIKTHFARIETLLARVVAAGQGTGQLSIRVPAMEAGGYLLSALNGLHVSAKAGAEPDQLRRRIDLILHALLP